jgi:tRNA modification GTPase
VRAAEPGEFTRRAFLAGRIDLTEAEGLADLLAAETEAQRRQAVAQASGALRTLYAGWRERLVRIRALIEADFDFADEEDVPGSVADAAWADATALRSEMRAHLDDGHRGERIRDGLQVVLLGRPNAGKSSLLNALARRDVAIVTEEPGTTRDLIEVHLDLGGWPVTVVDTAGLREAAGRVEAEGIRRALERCRSADLVLWLRAFDGADGGEGLPIEWDAVVWEVRTKSDLGSAQPPPGRFESATKSLALSVVTGEGLDHLVAALGDFAAECSGTSNAVAPTRERHRSHLTAALRELDRAVEGIDSEAELRSEDLRRAGVELGRITGEIGVEELLDVIFGEFCIGK